VSAASSSGQVTVALAGSGGSRTITLTPAVGFEGQADITVTVSDGDLTATRTFSLMVRQLVASSDDFSGDGLSDIVLQHTDGFVAVWNMDGAELIGSSFTTPNTTGDARWKVVGVNDFNGDGKPDLLLRHTDDFIAVWLMDGTEVDEGVFTSPSRAGDAGWRIIGTGDFNGDGKPDLLFRHTDRSNAVWYMDGVTRIGAAFINPSKIGDPSWTLSGVGDFNGDGKDDLVLTHTTGLVGVWFLNGVTMTQGALFQPSSTGDAGWKVGAVGDYNGDGKPDLVFQYTDRTMAVWYMDGVERIGAELLRPNNPGAGWTVVGPK
jgi:hypothetical protein